MRSCFRWMKTCIFVFISLWALCKSYWTNPYKALRCCINIWDRHWFSHIAPDNNRGNLLLLLWRWTADFISLKYSRYILKTFHPGLIQLVKIASNEWVYFEGRKKQGMRLNCDQIPTGGVGMLPTGSIHSDEIWLECFECLVQLPSTFFLCLPDIIQVKYVILHVIYCMNILKIPFGMSC